MLKRNRNKVLSNHTSSNLCNKKNLLIYCICFLGFIMCAIPFMRCGIIVNDELKARRLAMEGFFNFYKTEFSEWKNQGRILAALINSFTKYVGFIGASNSNYYKLFQIIVLLMITVSYFIFCRKALKNNNFAIYTGILSFVMLPISFEHTSPNAFVSLFGLPFILLLSSFTLYIDFIDKSLQENKGWKALLSMILFFFSCMSYEIFVTYVVLYFMIVLGKTGFKAIFKNIKLYMMPLFTALLYIICYIVQGKIFPSHYEGNQIGIKGIMGPVKVIRDMFLASVPGFYVLSSKYKYIRSVYNRMDTFDYVRIGILVVIFVYIVISLILIERKKDNVKECKDMLKTVGKNFYIIFTAICFMILPSIPNSIALMYQGNTGVNGFTALPVTFFEYFAAVFLVSYVTWMILLLLGKYFYPVVVVLVIFVVKIQQMNDSFSHEQNSNYMRLVTIEQFLSTDSVSQLSGSIFYSKDLYKQNNALAIHDGYWTQYCNENLGIPLQIAGSFIDDRTGNIYYDDDNFVIITKDEVKVLSLDKESNVKQIMIGDGKFIDFDFKNEKIDNNFYVYSCENNKDYLSLESYFADYGYYDDGWLKKNSAFHVDTGNNGKIIMKLMYPGDDYYGKGVTVSINDEIEYSAEFNNHELQIEMDSAKNTSVELKISFDFEITDKGNDVRELSAVLQEFIIE